MSIPAVMLQWYLRVFPRPEFENQDKNRLSGACADINGFTIIALILYVLQNVWTKGSPPAAVLLIFYLVLYLFVERWALFKGWAQATVLTYVVVMGVFWLRLTFIASTIAHTQTMVLCLGLAYITITLGARYGLWVLLAYTGLLWGVSFGDHAPAMPYAQTIKQCVVATTILAVLFVACAILRRHLIETIQTALNERDEARTTLEHANLRLSELLFEKSSQLVERMEMAMLSMGTLAHEFRTPIASMSMSNEFMINAIETDSVDCKRFFPLLKNTELILSRMNKHIDSSMINVGVLLKDRLQLPVARVDIGAIVKDALEVNKIGFSKAGQMRIHIEEGCWARADGTMFEHVFVNLMSNAMKALSAKKKHDNGPQISIDLYKKNAQIVLRISDRGVGIRPEILGKIYDPFYSSSGTPSHGLGLTMVQKAVHAMGGTIICTSEVDVGTTFEVLLNAYDSIGTPIPPGGWGSSDRRQSKRPELT